MSLDKDFIEKHGEFINQNKRGYGYWLWKPQVCIQTFDKMEDGDILVYADVGCFINSQGSKFHKYYVQLAVNNGYAFIEDIYKIYEWTKGDLFKALDAYDHANENQLHGCNFYLKKTPENVKFLNEWLEWCSKYDLLTDVPSVNSNLPGFNEHRHDQAILTLLVKKKGMEVVHHNLNQCFCSVYKGYAGLIDYPIWYLRLSKGDGSNVVLDHFKIKLKLDPPNIE